MISTVEIIIRLLLGALFGGIIGFERHAHGRPAGFRTHLLVCVSSVLIMIVSEYYHYLSLLDPAYIRIDPARLAAGAITGVGFLGAGVIVKVGVNVQGLTTAASLWIVSAIGLATGSGLYTAGLVGFVITYLSLWILRLVEDRMPSVDYKFMTVIMSGPGNEEAIRSAVKKHEARVSKTDYERDIEKNEASFQITIVYKNEAAIRNILDAVSSLPSVKRVSIKS